MFTPFETLVIKMLVRLFWLITQSTGVARYASDVKTFTEADISIGGISEEDGKKLIAGYEKGR